MSVSGSPSRLVPLIARIDSSSGDMFESPYARMEAHGGGHLAHSPVTADGPRASRMFLRVGAVPEILQRVKVQQGQLQEYLKKAEYTMQSGGDYERHLAMASEVFEQLKTCAVELHRRGQPSEPVQKNLDQYEQKLLRLRYGIAFPLEDVGRSFQDAIGWIGQKKVPAFYFWCCSFESVQPRGVAIAREGDHTQLTYDLGLPQRLIETAPWADDPAAIEQQITNHNRFHSSIQRSSEVERARDELVH
ncbi:hypothetical protein Z043_117638 [Scleropages formosus]|uniref:Uncharacterized protein n=1 Tax=Scleropages formosus TaxID=113540 RepID=A0A0P7YCS0_SCLFO|nr:hypothetical protein Z043_117638 [Scleropages formosus]